VAGSRWPVNGTVVQQLLQALGEQQAPQPLHLPLQLPDQFGVWIFVDDGVAADLLCTVSVPGTTSDLRLDDRPQVRLEASGKTRGLR